MAKHKGGLGRGLDSLLGGAPEGGLTRERVNAPEHAPSQKNVSSRVEDGKRPVRKSVMQSTGDDSEPYAINEDKLTIKGVVHREVSSAPKPPAQKRTVSSSPSVEESQRETDEIDIDLIDPNPDQPRTNFKKEELEELAESIKKNGLLQPILVRKAEDRYQIIAGERRWQACKQVGLEKVPVRIKDADDEQTLILALIENVQRSDLNPIEEAYGYRRMMERGHMTQTQIAQAVSKGRSTIANALRLLELPEEAQQLLFEEEISAGHARAILSIPTTDGRAKLTRKLMEDKLTVREAEALAKQLSGKQEKKQKDPKPAPPKSYKTVARSLRDTLQTDVRVKSSNGKNTIEITFNDEADLQRLYRIIASE